MIRIVKLGGSLLDWPQFPAALRSWLSKQRPACNALIAGGGALADAIWRADRDFGIGEATCHWLCIDALSITARIVAAAVPDFPLISGYADLKSTVMSQHSGAIVFDPREFLARHEACQSDRPLPHNWTVTSDSIAARIAQCLPADELVLLKSIDQPSGSLIDLAALGYVDRYFPTATAKMPPPRFVNLRTMAF
jgi:aspartokinase-like uncharacterized kinase